MTRPPSDKKPGAGGPVVPPAVPGAKTGAPDPHNKSQEPPAAASAEKPSAASAFRDLLPRLISGAVLALGAIGLTYWGLLPFAVLVMAVALILCWEWASVVRGRWQDPTFLVHVLAVAAAVVLGALNMAGLALVVLAIGALAIVGLEFGNRSRLSAAGVLYAGLPAVGLLWFRGDDPHGFAAVMFLFLAIWSTDIGAYIAGRAIGGPKLWPAVSPKKTWSGLIGGVLSGGLAGMLCAIYLADAPAGTTALTAILLALISQGGDMAESALKRRFDIKDSSALIPGHGGFMDRVDGLIAAVVAAALFAIAVNAAAPATALLFWS